MLESFIWDARNNGFKSALNWLSWRLGLEGCVFWHNLFDGFNY